MAVVEGFVDVVDLALDWEGSLVSGCWKVICCGRSHSRMRMPSFSWSVMLYSWLLPALFFTAKAALWAATSVMLLYFLLQNSG